MPCFQQHAQLPAASSRRERHIERSRHRRLSAVLAEPGSGDDDLCRHPAPARRPLHDVVGRSGQRQPVLVVAHRWSHSVPTIRRLRRTFRGDPPNGGRGSAAHWPRRRRDERRPRLAVDRGDGQGACSPGAAANSTFRRIPSSTTDSSPTGNANFRDWWDRHWTFPSTIWPLTTIRCSNRMPERTNRHRNRSTLFQQPAANADFYRMVAAHSRVLLTGWDGDALLSESPGLYFRELLKKRELAELVAGLGWFIGVEHTLPPMGVRTWIKRKLGRYPVRSRYPSWIHPAFASRIDLRGRWARMNAELRPAHPTRPMTSTSLSVPNWWALFERYDAGVTGLPLEARHPLLDRRLVQYVLAIPPVPWSIGKHMLRVAMVGTLPEAVRRRPKAGLAGDPAVEMLRASGGHSLDNFAPSARLANFVRRECGPAHRRRGRLHQAVAQSSPPHSQSMARERHFRCPRRREAQRNGNAGPFFRRELILYSFRGCPPKRVDLGRPEVIG